MPMTQEMIVRKVWLNLDRSPQEALDATHREQYIREDVVRSMPMPTGGDDEEVEIIFFNCGRNHPDSSFDLDKECGLRGLKPADPYSVAAVNEDDPAFSDEKPNGTQWREPRATCVSSRSMVAKMGAQYSSAIAITTGRLTCGVPEFASKIKTRTERVREYTGFQSVFFVAKLGPGSQSEPGLLPYS